MRLRYDRLVRRPTMPSPYGLFSLAKSFLTGTTILCPRCWWLLTLTTSCFRRTLGWTAEPDFAFRHPRSKGLNRGGGSILRDCSSFHFFVCMWRIRWRPTSWDDSSLVRSYPERFPWARSHLAVWGQPPTESQKPRQHSWTTHPAGLPAKTHLINTP